MAKSLEVYEFVFTRDFTPEGATVLDADQVSNYLAVLVRLASIDGLEPDERIFVQRAAASLGLQPDLADIAGKFVRDPSISSESLIEGIRDPGLRLCLLRDSYRLAAADGRFSEAEIGELAHIVRALGIPSGVAAEVRTIALQEARLHREFAGLVRVARG